MLRDERFYPSFKQNALYVRMLAELDMLKDPSFRGSDDGEGGELRGISWDLSIFFFNMEIKLSMPFENSNAWYTSSFGHWAISGR